HPVDETDRGADDAAGNRLMRSHGLLLAYSAGARTDHKVEFAVEDRRHQVRYPLRPVAAVAIEKYQDLRPAFARHGRTLGAGPAIAALLLDHNSGSRSAGHRDRAVAA